MNTYGYAYQNPLRYTDPSGLAPNPAELTCVDPLQPVCWGGVAADILTSVGTGIAVGAGASAASTPQSCKDDCKPLYAQITSRLNELKARYAALINNPGNLPPSGAMSIAGHQQQFRDKQANLRSLLNQANAKGCTAYEPDAWEWATKPTPSPGWGGVTK